MMAVWDHLGYRNLIDMQRAMALRAMGDECRELLAEGYAVDADRKLEEMAERMRSWRVGEPEWGR